MDLCENFLLKELDPEGLDSLQLFRDKKCIFETLMKKGIESPQTFWGMAKSDLALKLIKIPASTAQLERLFSNWSFVHNPARSKLSQSNSKKLVHCYYALKTKDKNKCDEY